MNCQISISFIIPYYNIEKELITRCLKSIIISMNGLNIEWEALVIDDGSTYYNLRNLIDEFNCKNIKYHYQKNSGLSSARNKGIELSGMKYIHFLDADDYIIPTAIKRIIKFIIAEHNSNNDIDLFAFNYQITHNKDFHDYNNKDFNIKYHGSGIDFMLKYNLHSSACCFFFKKSILEDIRFTPNLLHEDEDFTPRLFVKCKTVYICTVKAYAYYQRNNSITNNKNYSNLKRRYSDLIKILENIKNESKKTENIKIKKALLRRIDILSSDIIYKLINDMTKTEYINEYLNKMEQRNFFPLKIKFHSLRYLIISLISGNQKILLLIMKLFCIKKYIQRKISKKTSDNFVI